MPRDRYLDLAQLRLQLPRTRPLPDRLWTPTMGTRDLANFDALLIRQTAAQVALPLPTRVLHVPLQRRKRLEVVGNVERHRHRDCLRHDLSHRGVRFLRSTWTPRHTTLYRSSQTMQTARRRRNTGAYQNQAHDSGCFPNPPARCAQSTSAPRYGRANRATDGVTREEDRGLLR